MKHTFSKLICVIAILGVCSNHADAQVQEVDNANKAAMLEKMLQLDLASRGASNSQSSCTIRTFACEGEFSEIQELKWNPLGGGGTTEFQYAEITKTTIEEIESNCNLVFSSTSAWIEGFNSSTEWNSSASQEAKSATFQQLTIGPYKAPIKDKTFISIRFSESAARRLKYKPGIQAMLPSTRVSTSIGFKGDSIALRICNSGKTSMITIVKLDIVAAAKTALNQGHLSAPTNQSPVVPASASGSLPVPVPHEPLGAKDM